MKSDLGIIFKETKWITKKQMYMYMKCMSLFPLALFYNERIDYEHWVFGYTDDQTVEPNYSFGCFEIFRSKAKLQR